MVVPQIPLSWACLVCSIGLESVLSSPPSCLDTFGLLLLLLEDEMPLGFLVAQDKHTWSATAVVTCWGIS